MAITLNKASLPYTANPFIGGLISGGLGLIGGILGNKSASDSAAKNAASSERVAQMNIDMQKEFAQHGVSWKAEDARAAGIDPLAAVGAPVSYYPTNYTPIDYKKDYSYLGKAGQDISRAIGSTQTKAQRELQALQLERAHLENDYALIRNVKANKDLMNMDTQQGPSFPQDGYGETDGAISSSSNRIVHTPDQRTRSRQKNPGITAAMQPFTTQWIDDKGRVRQTISERSAESVESDMVGWAENNAIRAGEKIRSYLGPTEKPKIKPPKGHVWVYKRTWHGGYWHAVKRGKPGSLRWQGKEYKGGRVIHHGKIWK